MTYDISIGMDRVEHCYNEIRNLIINCTFPPGAILNEKSLMERLSFGRTPIREALLRLDHDGLVITKQRSGYQVRPLNRKSIEDILITWRTISPLIVNLSVQNMTAELRSEIAALGSGLVIEADGDPLRSSILSGRLFDRLVVIADNEPLHYIYRHIIASLERISYILLKLPHRKGWTNSLESVCEIACEPDPTKAAKLIRQRITQSEHAILSYLDRHQEALSFLPAERST